MSTLPRMTRWRALRDRLADWCEAEQSRLVLWLPVFMGAGVLVYYELRFEPPLWWGLAAAGASVGGAVLFRPVPVLRRCLAPIAAMALGFLSSQWSTAREPPIETGLPSRATIVSATIRAVDVLPEGRRITLDRARLDEADTPLVRDVRIRLRKNDQGPLTAGDTVRVRALVRPPAMPAYPGAWDLQRDAYYSGLGASGFALGPVERISTAIPSPGMRLVQWLREAIAAHVTAVIPGAAGEVSVTLLTGAAMGIPEAEHNAFRDAGLAHLLAVAGLHIGIVMGFALTLARTGLALSEHASLFWPTKKLAAIAAIAVGAAYMVLTGMHVPIVRSFTMACLFTAALLANRQPMSIRGLGLAGVALMLIEPHEVPGVSFQMSFSAVLALISGYEALRPWLRRLHGASWRRRVLAHIVALALTSALAGTASMPYGAYHFGHIQIYYVIANMVAVPLTAFWVMPLGLLSLPLMPLGLDWLTLVPMGWGAEAIVRVATVTASWPTAIIAVPHIPAWGLLLVSGGLAWLGIWRTPLRLLGLLPLAVGLVSPAMNHPPDILIAADARLIGFRSADGVWLQTSQGGSRFTRDAWLQYWNVAQGRPLPVQGRSEDGAVDCIKDSCVLRLGETRQGVLVARGVARREACLDIAIIVSAEPARGICPRPWPKLADRFTVWRDGSVAVWLEPTGAHFITDRQARGSRPWVPPPPTPRPRPAPALPSAPADATRLLAEPGAAADAARLPPEPGAEEPSFMRQGATGSDDRR